MPLPASRRIAHNSSSESPSPNSARQRLLNHHHHRPLIRANGQPTSSCFATAEPPTPNRREETRHLKHRRNPFIRRSHACRSAMNHQRNILTNVRRISQRHSSTSPILSAIAYRPLYRNLAPTPTNHDPSSSSTVTARRRYRLAGQICRTRCTSRQTNFSELRNTTIPNNLKWAS